MYFAAMVDAKQVVEVLISKGADINAKNNRVRTPLYVAAQYAANKVEEVLRSKGALE